MSGKTILIIAGVFLAVCCILVVVAAALGGLAAFGLTQPAVDAGDAFMAAARDDRYADAYNLCTAGLKEEVKSPQALKDLIESGKARPVKWSFSSRSVSGNTAELEGSVIFTGDWGRKVNLTVNKVGNDWKVNAFDFKGK